MNGYKINRWIASLIFLLIFGQILFLHPVSISPSEEEIAVSVFQSLESMENAKRLEDEVGYSMEGVHYINSENGKKSWEMKSKDAVMYQQLQLIDSSNVEILIYDEDLKKTRILSNRAFYYLEKKKLILEGNVKILFPDGFQVETQKAHYIAETGILETIENVYGESAAKGKTEVLKVWSKGFWAQKNKAEILLPENVKIQVHKKMDPEIIESVADRARIDRFNHQISLTMQDPKGLVETRKGNTYVRSRKQELHYQSDKRQAENLIATEDVLIREIGIQYATAQRAEFLVPRDHIVLSGFPSVYQEQDTLTGEIIILDRKKHLVEVIQANAYHSAEPEKTQQGKKK